MSKVFLVGNAPLTRDYAAMIDAADMVVRFNEPQSYGGWGGTRFDAWVIANGKGGRRFANRKVFESAPFRDQPKEIWFPRSMDVHAALRRTHSDEDILLGEKSESDCSQRILRANNLKQETRHFTAELYWTCLDILRSAAVANEPLRVPSAGFMALHHVMLDLRRTDVSLVGFTFEGWHGHPWHLEKRVIEGLARRGVLTLLPA